jgi:DNA-binding phage protein
MKDKASISHDEVLIRKLRNSKAFATEYLKAAIEDAEEPQVLTIALRQIAEGEGGHRQGGRSSGNQTRKPLPRAFSTRQSASLHAFRSHQGNGTDADGRAFPGDA